MYAVRIFIVLVCLVVGKNFATDPFNARQFLLTSAQNSFTSSSCAPLSIRAVFHESGFPATHLSEAGLLNLTKGSQLNPYNMHDYLNMLPANVWASSLRNETVQNLLQTTDLFRYKGYAQYVQDQVLRSPAHRDTFVNMVAQINTGKGIYFEAYTHNKAWRNSINEIKEAVLKQLASPSKLNVEGWHIKMTLQGSHPYGKFDYYKYPAFKQYLKTLPNFSQEIKQITECTQLAGRCHWKIEYKKNKHFRKFIDECRQELAQAPQLSMPEVQRNIAQFETIQSADIVTPEKVEAAHLLMEQESSAIHAAQIPSSEFAHAVLENRVAAIEEFKHDIAVTHVEYDLSQESVAVLNEHKLDHALFKSCEGSVVQQQAHTELVDVTHEAGKLLEHSAIHADKMAYNTSAYAANMAFIGVEFNNKGYASRAFKISDFCYAIMDVTNGVLKGGFDHATGFVHVLMHPVDTARGIVHGVKGLCDLSHCYYRRVLAPALRESDKGLILDVPLQTKLSDEFWQEILTPLHDRWQQLSLEDKTRLVTSAALDYVVPASALKKASAVAIMGSRQALNTIHKIGKGFVPMRTAVTAEGLTANVPRYAQMINAYQADTVSKFKTFSGKRLPKLLNRYGDSCKLGFKKIPRACWPPFDKMMVSLDSLKHVLGVEMKMKVDAFGKWFCSETSGGHFGDVEVLKKIGHIPADARYVTNPRSGVVSIFGKNGCVVKTLFPKHWDEGQVLQCIYEACANITENPIFQEKSRNWVLIGECSNGIKIKILVSSVGKLVTAYPI